MTKQSIESQIEKMCKENISYKGLPPPYRTGLKNFKAEVVKFIYSNKENEELRKMLKQAISNIKELDGGEDRQFAIQTILDGEQLLKRKK